MLLSEVLAFMRTRMARATSSTTITDAELTLELRLAQDLYQKKEILPWFIVKTPRKEWTLFEGFKAIAAPNDFIRELDSDGVALVCGTTVTPLLKGDYNVLVKRYGRNAGIPERYAIQGNYLYLFPFILDTSAGYQVELGYYFKTEFPTELEETNEWLANVPELLAEEAIANYFEFTLLKKEDAQLHRTRASILEQELRTAIIARDEANRTTTMGDYHA